MFSERNKLNSKLDIISFKVCLKGLLISMFLLALNKGNDTAILSKSDRSLTLILSNIFALILARSAIKSRCAGT